MVRIASRSATYGEMVKEEQAEQTINYTKKQTQYEESMEQITVGELAEAVKSMKNEKTWGRDKITMEMVKCMGAIGTEYLLWILNKAWKEQIIIWDWKTGVMLAT